MEESRHKVPQQCLRDPSTVASKPVKTSTSLAKNPDRAAMVREVIPSTQVHIHGAPNHMVEYEAEAGEAGPSTSQATGGTLLAKPRVNSSKGHARKEEWVMGTKVLTVTVKAAARSHRS